VSRLDRSRTGLPLGCDVSHPRQIPTRCRWAGPKAAVDAAAIKMEKRSGHGCVAEQRILPWDEAGRLDIDCHTHHDKVLKVFCNGKFRRRYM
jgi:hypothetical protein